MKEIRKEKKLTQEDVADRLGIHRVQYIRYESGESEISLSLAQQIADALKEPVEFLLIPIEDLSIPKPTEDVAEFIAWIKQASPDLVKTLKGICVPVIRAHARSNSQGNSK